MKKVLVIFIIIVACLSRTAIAHAYDPLSVDNNKVGIDIVDTNDLDRARQLVNSNGGDWGYVTFVIQKGERDTSRWQSVMDRMRHLHLIPIIRIATAATYNGSGNSVWEKPADGEIDGWVSFLNSLNWVIKNRYVIIGNEPNHAKEWGGEIDPVAYGKYLKTFSQKLKASNPDFFILPAAMDASANTNTRGQDATMDEALYLQKMFESDAHVYDYIDGLNSHSYPNPGFAGPGDGTGKGTVATWNWELDYLKFFGVSKNLPVFITETGWTHTIDSLDTDIPSKIETAFKNSWSDKRIVTVTPFILKYDQPPFDTFSWINKEGENYDFYNTLVNLQKIKGQPIQNTSGDIITGTTPKIAMAQSVYRAILVIKNTGQSIWQIQEIGAVDGQGNKLTIDSMFPENIEPNQIGVFVIKGKFPNKTGGFKNDIFLISNGQTMTSGFVSDVTLIQSFPSFSDVVNYFKLIISKKLGS